MRRRRWAALGAAVVVAATLAFAACGSGDDDDDDFANGDDITVPAGQPTTGSPVPQPTSGVATTVGVDANATTPQRDATASFPVGTEFSAAFMLESVGGPYHGYQVHMNWDGAIVAYQRVENLSPAGLTFCSPIAQPTETSLVSFCANSQLIDQTFAGPVARIVFKCSAAGEVKLHLLTVSEGLGTSVVLSQQETQVMHDLTMNDATVTCT
jgi:hypothetical protein